MLLVVGPMWTSGDQNSILLDPALVLEMFCEISITGQEPLVGFENMT
jgi:hypothetical protein